MHGPWGGGAALQLCLLIIPSLNLVSLTNEAATELQKKTIWFSNLWFIDSIRTRGDLSSAFSGSMITVVILILVFIFLLLK